MRKYMHSDHREGIPGIMDEKVHVNQVRVEKESQGSWIRKYMYI
jgi:hypothetical protein